MSNSVVAEAIHFENGELVFLAPVAFVPGYLEPLLLELSDGTSRNVRVQMKTSRSLPVINALSALLLLGTIILVATSQWLTRPTRKT